MTISQDIFNGLSADWKWASMASNGVARVHTDKPSISLDNVVLFKLGKHHTALRGEFDATDMPPEGLTPVIVERSALASAPPYATNGKGVAVDMPMPCEPREVISQDVFKHFGPNWTWASIDRSGQAWLHTYEPNEVPRMNDGTQKNVRAPAFDLDREFPQRINVKRSSFLNGPTYNTDEFGIGLFEPQPIGFAPAPQPMAPPATVYITVDQAESGRLWDFANPDENYVSVNLFGEVWFNTGSFGAKERRCYAVLVHGVTHAIERTRSQPQLAPPEAGKPFVSLAVDYPAPGLREDGSDESHGWTNELDEAKARAQRLLSVYVLDGNNERPALNEMQYMAIFGELPE